MPAGRRLFNDKEINAILKRATEIQHTEGDKTSGLSMEEIQQLAAEVGIHPDHIRAAVSELATREEEDDTFHFFGGPVSVEVERIVDGEMTDVTWEAVVGAIRKEMKRVGQVGQLGQSFEWVDQERRGNRGDEAHVTVTPRNGQTRVRIYMHHPSLAALSYAPIMSIGLAMAINIPILLQLTPLLGISVSITMMGMLFMVSRFLFTTLARKKKRQAAALMQRIEEVIEEQAPLEIRGATTTMQEDTLLRAAALDIEPPEELPAATQKATRTRT